MKHVPGNKTCEASGAVRDALAGIVFAAVDIPQALGYTRIAGNAIVTGLYALLLPLLAFAAFGSSRFLVVAADSATAAILRGGSAAWPPRRARDTSLLPAWSPCSPRDFASRAPAQVRLHCRLPLPDSARRLSHRSRLLVGIAVLGQMLVSRPPPVGRSFNSTRYAADSLTRRFRPCSLRSLFSLPSLFFIGLPRKSLAHCWLSSALLQPVRSGTLPDTVSPLLDLSSAVCRISDSPTCTGAICFR